MNNIKKILIIKQTSLGDVLHATAFIREISLIYPDALIDIVTDKSALDILKHNPHINKFYILDIYRYEKQILKSVKYFFSVLKEFFSIIKDVRKEHYDLAFDLQGLERSVIFLYLCHSKQKYAIGNKWIFSKHKDVKKYHVIKLLLSLLEMIGHKSDNTKLDFYLPENIEITFNEMLEKNNISLNKNYIVISGFSRWVTKDLPIKKSIEIIKCIRKKSDIDIVLTSIENEYEKCMNIKNAFQNDASIHVFSKILNINTLAALIKNSRAIISVDSFPMHIATCFETPLIALFGPTSEHRIGPISKNSYVIKSENIDCLMCYRSSNCPNNHSCMNSLDAQNIANIVLKYI